MLEMQWQAEDAEGNGVVENRNQREGKWNSLYGIIVSVRDAGWTTGTHLQQRP